MFARFVNISCKTLKDILIIYFFHLSSMFLLQRVLFKVNVMVNAIKYVLKFPRSLVYSFFKKIRTNIPRIDMQNTITQYLL